MSDPTDHLHVDRRSGMSVDVQLRERVAAVETTVQHIQKTAIDHVEMDRVDHAALHGAIARGEEKIERRLDDLGDKIDNKLEKRRNEVDEKLDEILATVQNGQLDQAEKRGGWKATIRIFSALLGSGAVGGGAVMGLLQLFGDSP
jgi:DNA anti-recombination protein RmuC